MYGADVAAATLGNGASDVNRYTSGCGAWTPQRRKLELLMQDLQRQVLLNALLKFVIERGYAFL